MNTRDRSHLPGGSFVCSYRRASTFYRYTDDFGDVRLSSLIQVPQKEARAPRFVLPAWEGASVGLSAWSSAWPAFWQLPVSETHLCLHYWRYLRCSSYRSYHVSEVCCPLQADLRQSGAASPSSDEVDDFFEGGHTMFGKPHVTREGIRQARRIVVKLSSPDQRLP